jgi:hypothetical protein
MNLRMARDHYRLMRRVTAESFAPGVAWPAETGCVLLLGRNQHAVRPSLLTADVLVPEAGDVVERSGAGLVFSSSFLRRALLAVRKRSLAGLLTVHTHPLSDQVVAFSEFDDANDPRLAENLYDLYPDGIFGSIVLGRRSAAARVWDRAGCLATPLGELVVVGEELAFFPLDGRPAPMPAHPAEVFDRGLAVTGSGALARLASMRVGLVGASGTGALLAELLVRAGAGELAIAEFDRYEPSNLNRVLHARRRDAEGRASKGVRLKQALDELGMPTRITLIPGGDVRIDSVARDLAGCDLLLGCVDNRHWPRLVMSELSYQYIVPFVDLGSEIGVSGETIQSVDARVSYVAPGRACLACSRIISAEQVRLESLSAGERDRVVAMGYSTLVPLAAPAVMDVNMRAASYAMLVVRHVLQPFLDRPIPTHIKEALTNYSIRRLSYDRAADCAVCGADWRLGAGDAVRLTTVSDAATSSGRPDAA